MKNLLTTLTAALCALFCASAQDISLGRLTADGNRVYVEFIDVRNNIEDDAKPFIAALKGPEWNRWQVVDDKADADFVLRIRVEKKGSGFSISWGARMFTTVSILTTDGRELWRANSRKAAPVNSRGSTPRRMPHAKSYAARWERSCRKL